METNGIGISLVIRNFDCDPTEITNQLGTAPSRTWYMGIPIRPGGLKPVSNGWEIASGLEESAEFADHLSALVSIIEKHLDAFMKVCNRYSAEVSCAVYISEDEDVSTPWINISLNAIRVFATIGATIDFDIYK